MLGLKMGYVAQSMLGLKISSCVFQSEGPDGSTSNVVKNEDDEDEEFIWEEVDKLLKSDRERVQDNVVSILEDLCKGTRFVAAELWTLPHGVSAPSPNFCSMRVHFRYTLWICSCILVCFDARRWNTCVRLGLELWVCDLVPLPLDYVFRLTVSTVREGAQLGCRGGFCK
jgi:hypothetical protein